MARMRRIGVAVAAASIALAGCGGPDAADAPENAASQEVTWQSVDGFQVPAAEAGPADTAAEIPAGFEQSGFGAALAAANYSVVLDTADESEFGKVLNAVTVDDEGRRQWAAARAGLVLGQARADRVPTLEAWSSEPPAAKEHSTIHLYWRQYDGSLTEQRREMSWEGDDWKLKLPDNPQQPELRAVDDVPENAEAFSPPA